MKSEVGTDFAFLLLPRLRTSPSDFDIHFSLFPIQIVVPYSNRCSLFIVFFAYRLHSEVETHPSHFYFYLPFIIHLLISIFTIHYSLFNNRFHIQDIKPMITTIKPNAISINRYFFIKQHQASLPPQRELNLIQVSDITGTLYYMVVLKD